MCQHFQCKGHYSTYCFTKLEEIAVLEESNLDSAFLNTVEDNTNTSWMTQIKLNGQDTVFKLNTGAEVSAVTQDTYKRLGIHKRFYMDLHKPPEGYWTVSRETTVQW